MSGRSGILKNTAPDRAAISEILSVAMALSNVHTSKSGSWTGGEMRLVHNSYRERKNVQFGR